MHGEKFYHFHTEETPTSTQANNKSADQPAHPRNLISTFVFSSLESMIAILATCKISRFWLVSVAEQASLSLTWSQTSKKGFLTMMAIWVSNSDYLFDVDLTLISENVVCFCVCCIFSGAL